MDIILVTMDDNKDHDEGKIIEPKFSLSELEIRRKEVDKKIEISEKEVVKEKGEEDNKEEKEKKIRPTGDYRTDPLFYDVANYFSIEHDDYSFVKNKLSVIVDWALERVGARDGAEVLTTIRELEDSLTTPGMGEKRHNIVYRYIVLDAQIKNLEKKMSVYKKNIEKKVE